MRAASAGALLIALVLGGSAAAAPAGGVARRSQLEDAVATYTRALETADRDRRLEEFRRAERLFARAVEGGLASADLYANLGSAALQAERLGPAVLAYRRALRLDPGHARAAQNLQHARGLLPDWVPRPESQGLLDSFFFWHRTLPREQRQLAAALCFSSLAVLLAAGLRFQQTALRNAAWLPGVAWAVLLASLLLDPEGPLGIGDADDQAVVVAEELVARAADSPLAPAALPAPLPGGAEVRILEERSPWMRVRLANGRDAWVSESGVSRVWERRAKSQPRDGRGTARRPAGPGAAGRRRAA